MVLGSEPFIAAIKYAPDDDAPRLIYADWLDDHGEADRAEFIRAQIEAEPLAVDRVENGPSIHESRLQKLLHRERQLWSMSLGWSYPLNGAFDWFRRGFVERPTLPAATWLSHADAMLAVHPIREVRLTTIPMVLPGNDCFVLRGDPERVQIPAIVLDALYPPDTLAHICLRYRFQGITFHIQTFDVSWQGPPFNIRESLEELRRLAETATNRAFADTQ